MPPRPVCLGISLQFTIIYYSISYGRTVQLQIISIAIANNVYLQYYVWAICASYCILTMFGLLPLLHLFYLVGLFVPLTMLLLLGLI